MHKIEIVVDEIEYSKELYELADSHDEIDIITEK